MSRRARILQPDARVDHVGQLGRIQRHPCAEIQEENALLLVGVNAGQHVQRPQRRPLDAEGHVVGEMLGGDAHLDAQRAGRLPDNPTLSA